jgi:putative endonuclease
MAVIFKGYGTNMKQNAKKNLIKKQRGLASFKRGHFAELLACIILTFKGYIIRARRYKAVRSEIDIVAQRGCTLCFIEVKRRNSLPEAAYSLSKKQQRRIERVATYYLTQYPFAGTKRFDTIIFGRYFVFNHIEDVWRD